MTRRESNRKEMTTRSTVFFLLEKKMEEQPSLLFYLSGLTGLSNELGDMLECKYSAQLGVPIMGGDALFGGKKYQYLGGSRYCAESLVWRWQKLILSADPWCQ